MKKHLNQEQYTINDLFSPEKLKNNVVNPAKIFTFILWKQKCFLIVKNVHK